MAHVICQLGDVSMAVTMVEVAWEILLDYDADVAEFVRQSTAPGAEPKPLWYLVIVRLLHQKGYSK